MRTKSHLPLAALLVPGLVAGYAGMAGAGDEDVFPIGHGSVADAQYPWHVRLYGNAEDTAGFCGGSLIAPQWVLTAAHCVVDPQTGASVGGIVVGYGSADRTKTTQAKSASIIVHPDHVASPRSTSP